MKTDKVFIAWEFDFAQWFIDWVFIHIDWEDEDVEFSTVLREIQENEIDAVETYLFNKYWAEFIEYVVEELNS